MNRREVPKKLRQFMDSHPKKGKIGAFEGAGYLSKGLYRPEVDCLMFTKTSETFCQPCSKAITHRIKWLIDK